MTNSINSLQSTLWKWILTGFASLVLVYGVFRIIPIMRGVEIQIALPSQSEIQNDSFVLTGVADHARTLTINGRAILIDPAGNFSDEVILSPGINKITLVAQDIRGNFHKKEFVMNGSKSIAEYAVHEVAQVFIKNDTH